MNPQSARAYRLPVLQVCAVVLGLLQIALFLTVARAESVPPVSPASGLRLDRPALERATGSPPAPGSPAAGEDLAIALWLQQARTPEMEADTWALLDRNLTRFSRALGLDMDKSTPHINAGLKDFLEPVDAVTSGIKLRYRRPRPFISHASIKPCLPREQGFSFPSGHSTWFRVAAELLADLVPERRARLLAVGSHGGNSRVLCGVHYPSDVEAGQRLGSAAAAQLLATSQWQAFKQDPAVRSEIALIRSVPEADLMQLVR
jgi:acid phosphatase (class A)